MNAISRTRHNFFRKIKDLVIICDLNSQNVSSFKTVALKQVFSIFVLKIIFSKILRWWVLNGEIKIMSELKDWMIDVK